MIPPSSYVEQQSVHGGLYELWATASSVFDNLIIPEILNKSIIPAYNCMIRPFGKFNGEFNIPPVVNKLCLRAQKFHEVRPGYAFLGNQILGDAGQAVLVIGEKFFRVLF
jgi:hypothetical protein